MKRYDPRDSSRRRTRLAAAIVLAAIGAALLLGRGSVAPAIAVLVPALDAAAFLLLRRPIDPADLELRLAARPSGKSAVFLSGAAFVLRIGLRSAGSRPLRIAVLPLRPEGVEIDGPPGFLGDLPPGGEADLSLSGRLVRAGIVVFPGALVRVASPLGFFSRDVFLPDRHEVRVLPDYFTSRLPVVERALRAGGSPADALRPRAVKGEGTDFREIRDYRPSDPPRRVDWKATARHRRLLVREYEEPREFTIRVILDGSADLTESEGFGRAADLVAKLAFVASTQAMAFHLAVYDRDLLLSRSIASGKGGFRRLVADLVALPRQRLVRGASTAALERKARSVYRNRVLRGRFGPPLEDFLAAYRPDLPADPREFLADFAPRSLLDAPEACGDCGADLFPDEPECPRCGGGCDAVTDLPPRAAALAGALTEALRRSRGREMLLVVTALAGGEAADPLADLLSLAVAPWRRVHVVLPELRGRESARAEMPRSLGAYPEKDRTLRDADVFLAFVRSERFLSRLRAAGVRAHSLDAATDLDAVVAGLLLAEVV